MFTSLVNFDKATKVTGLLLEAVEDIFLDQICKINAGTDQNFRLEKKSTAKNPHTKVKRKGNENEIHQQQQVNCSKNLKRE